MSDLGTVMRLQRDDNNVTFVRLSNIGIINPRQGDVAPCNIKKKELSAINEEAE